MKIGIIDGNNIYFSHGNMIIYQLKKENKTKISKKDIGLLFHSVIKKLHTYLNIYDEVYWCWDTQTSSNWRKNIVPQYKQNRKKNELLNQLMENLKYLKKLFSYYPIYQLQSNKAEADDLILSVVKKNIDNEIEIISSDSDLLQIVQKYSNVKQYSPKKKKYLDKPDYDICLYKAIVGDRADNIPGLYRIGEKKVWAYLNNEKEFTFRQKESLKTYLKIIDLEQFEYKNELNEYVKNLKKNELNEDAIKMFFFYNNLNYLESNFDLIMEKIK